MFGTLGGPEIFLILVVALIVFGPRRLPEIGKSVGKMLGEFRRASNDFKRTIEDEIEAEKIREHTRLDVGASESSSYEPAHVESLPAHTPVESAPAEGAHLPEGAHPAAMPIEPLGNAAAPSATAGPTVSRDDVAFHAPIEPK